jgi:site-specific DNA-methyltransferase (adenine-specific)
MTFVLHHGDCLEKMKLIADKSVDLIICDLPYGCLKLGNANGAFPQRPNSSNDNNRKEGTIAGCAWDIKIDLEPFWKEVRRIRKDDHTPCIHFCSTKFGNDLINSNPYEFRYDLVWNKMRGVGFLSANKKPMASHEMIYVFSKKGANYNRIDISGEAYFKKSKNETCEQYKIKRTEGDNKGTRCVISVIEQYNTAGHNGKQHPTAKPADLYRWLITRYSKEGNTVLDPTFGSGNSGLVCRELNRNYIGIEMNEEFFKKAEERFTVN